MTGNRVVVVTGGTGLVGKGIEAYLAQNPRPHERWVFLGSKDGDLRKREEVEAIFRKTNPTYVIHLAATVGGLFKNMRQKVEMFRDNVAINDNVLACCKEFKVRKCVSCLSTCIFPDKTSFPFDETMVHSGPPHPSNEGYAYAKRMVDVLSRAYNEEYGCKFHSVIPTNIFGSHDNYHLEDSHVIPGLIHRTYLAQQKGEDLVVMGSGKPLRQFIYSIDLAGLLVWTLDSYEDLSPLILSVGEEDEVSIGDLAHMIAEAMGFTGKLIFDTTKADGQFKKTASNKKLLSLNPNARFTPIREAIKTTCEWFLENYETLRK